MLTQDFKTKRESVSRGAIDSCCLRRLPEYVNVRDESHVYVKRTVPAIAINAAWGSQWHQRCSTRVEKRREKSGRFLATSQRNQGAVNKKVS